MLRYKINIEYKGTNYHGWQKQKTGASSIQQEIETAIYKMLNENTEVYGSGRTDSGVHALNQVAHFDISKNIDPFKLQAGINYYLKNKDIVIFNASYAQEGFHARFSAKERSYVYKIKQRNYRLTFEKELYWHIQDELNVSNMQKASQYLIGYHDFSSFQSSGCQAKSALRTINKIEIISKKDIIEIHIYAPSFLYNMVRNIVGCLYEVGKGKKEPSDVKTILEAKSKTASSFKAPACGLYLKNITY